MLDKKIERINELARKSRDVGLTDAEKEEQAKLRREYIAGFRSSLTNVLDNTYIQSPDGSKTKVKKKS